MSSARVESVEQCPKCNDEGLDTAEDNLVTFADSGVKHCFRHGFMGKDNDTNVTTVKPKKSQGTVAYMSDQGLITDGECVSIQSRGISKATCQFYGYQVHKGKNIHIANYYDGAGNVKMQQWRTTDKKFPIFGDKTYNDTLWGMHKFTPNQQVFITITEGQIDALSVAEVFDCKYPVVSLPNGVSGKDDTQRAVSVLRASMHLLSGYKYVVLAFDDDKPGREATEACLSLFEPGKVRTAKFNGEKDANELLKVGKVKELRDCIYNAVAYLPPAILTGQSLLDTLTDYKTRTIDWPWKSFNDVLNPIYVPGVYSIAGRPNVGKTALMAELIRAQIAKGKKVGIISLEESVQKLLLKITSLITGIDLKNIRNRILNDDEINQCREVANNIVTFDHKTYGTDLSTICDSLPYIAQALECEMVIFDNLSYSATNASDDERRAIDRAMIRLQDTCVKYDFTLFNIAHLNSDDDTAKDATIRGSRGVQMYSSYVIHIDRDIESDDPILRNTLDFWVKKDRESGDDVGKHLQLKYNTRTRRLEDI